MKKESNLDFSLILASSVHDMKNSLGMLLHSLEELCNQLPQGNEQSLQANTIRYEAERVNHDLIQLLGVYRLENNKLAAHLDEHYLEDIFAEQLAQYQKVLQTQSIELSAQVDASLAWFFDRELVCGILNNALNNASRYTKERILISAETTIVNGHNFLKIMINDDGNGYPDTILEKNPNEILNDLSFRTGSTSLGLYFASQVASLHQEGEHKGKITLSNGGPLSGGMLTLLLP